MDVCTCVRVCVEVCVRVCTELCQASLGDQKVWAPETVSLWVTRTSPCSLAPRLGVCPRETQARDPVGQEPPGALPLTTPLSAPRSRSGLPRTWALDLRRGTLLSFSGSSPGLWLCSPNTALALKTFSFDRRVQTSQRSFWCLGPLSSHHCVRSPLGSWVSCGQYRRPTSPVSSSFLCPRCFLPPTLEVLPKSLAILKVLWGQES